MCKICCNSRLTDDYLDITNWMNIIEGEAGDMDSLAKIVDVKNYLGWAATDANGSSTEPVSVWGSDSDQESYIGRTRGLTERLTLSRYTEATGFDKPVFAEVEPDWFNRYWQYTTDYNDKWTLLSTLKIKLTAGVSGTAAKAQIL